MPSIQSLKPVLSNVCIATMLTTVVELCRTPESFNEVQLAVKRRIEDYFSVYPLEHSRKSLWDAIKPLLAQHS